MGTAQLITGHGGIAHVSQADAGSMHAGIVGAGRHVLNIGSKFAYTLVSNNLVILADGDLMNQGRHCRIRTNDTVNCTIENGLAGTKRNDIIVMRYSKDTTTSVESATLVVVKGTSGSTPADPSYTVGNILNGDTVDDFPLYRVRINGLNIEGIDTLFTVIDSLKTLSDKVLVNTTSIENVKTMISDSYSEIIPYAVGDLVIYNNVLYKCTTAITAEAWNSSHWTTTTIDAEHAAITGKMALKNISLEGGTNYRFTKICNSCKLHITSGASAYASSLGYSILTSANLVNSNTNLRPTANISAAMYDFTNKQFVSVTLLTTGYIMVKNAANADVTSSNIQGTLVWDID